MKRLHLHLRTADLAGARRFYSALFDASPTVEEPDYLKWMLEDPRVNFAVSTRAAGPAGINHLGVQADSADELEAIGERLARAKIDRVTERDAGCCYAQSDKHWVSDPDGVVWETFHTHGTRRTYGEDTTPDVQALAARQGTADGCCSG